MLRTSGKTLCERWKPCTSLELRHSRRESAKTEQLPTQYNLKNGVRSVCPHVSRIFKKSRGLRRFVSLGAARSPAGFALRQRPSAERSCFLFSLLTRP